MEHDAQAKTEESWREELAKVGDDLDIILKNLAVSAHRWGLLQDERTALIEDVDEEIFPPVERIEQLDAEIQQCEKHLRRHLGFAAWVSSDNIERMFKVGAAAAAGDGEIAEVTQLLAQFAALSAGCSNALAADGLNKPRLAAIVARAATVRALVEIAIYGGRPNFDWFALNDGWRPKRGACRARGVQRLSSREVGNQTASEEPKENDE